tara:strand:+ start:46644 stop:47507 length:864 start_codon:yes stop_codon:yes gene_type:complete
MPLLSKQPIADVALSATEAEKLTQYFAKLLQSPDKYCVCVNDVWHLMYSGRWHAIRRIRSLSETNRRFKGETHSSQEPHNCKLSRLGLVLLLKAAKGLRPLQILNLYNKSKRSALQNKPVKPANVSQSAIEAPKHWALDNNNNCIAANERFQFNKELFAQFKRAAVPTDGQISAFAEQLFVPAANDNVQLDRDLLKFRTTLFNRYCEFVQPTEQEKRSTAFDLFNLKTFCLQMPAAERARYQQQCVERLTFHAEWFTDFKKWFAPSQQAQLARAKTWFDPTMFTAAV